MLRVVLAGLRGQRILVLHAVLQRLLHCVGHLTGCGELRIARRRWQCAGSLSIQRGLLLPQRAEHEHGDGKGTRSKRAQVEQGAIGALEEDLAQHEAGEGHHVAGRHAPEQTKGPPKDWPHQLHQADRHAGRQ